MNLLYTYPAASKQYKPTIAYSYESLKSELPLELIKEWFQPIDFKWFDLEPKPVIDTEVKVTKSKSKITE